MQKLFNNILVPVTLDSGAGNTIEEAIRFANQFECNLHLVGLSQHSSLGLFGEQIFRLVNETDGSAEIKQKLAALQATYCTKLSKGLLLFVHHEMGEAEEVIANYAALHRVDLVFVVKEKRGFFPKRTRMSVNRLAGKTSCPVLSWRASLGIDGLKIIVMPVGKSLPINKIRVAAYLAKQCHSSIHLVTRERSGLMYEELAYMQKALQVLKDNTDLRVECKTLSGESIANIALEYAHKINAGMIIVNPGAESFLPGMINRFFSRFVSNESRIPVMTVV
jgi:nucleotide-binding universal stress UspA family protein